MSKSLWRRVRWARVATVFFATTENCKPARGMSGRGALRLTRAQGPAESSRARTLRCAVRSVSRGCCAFERCDPLTGQPPTNA